MYNTRLFANCLRLALPALLVVYMICVSAPSARASADIAMSEVKCSDSKVAAELADAVRANLSGIPQLKIAGTPGAQYRLDMACVVLDSHLLVNLRISDETGKRLIGGESALVARNELSSLLCQMASRVSARILAASLQDAPSKAQKAVKRLAPAVVAGR